MKPKAIFFDIDNTLYDTSKFAERARRNAINSMREAGLVASEEAAYKVLRKVIEKRTSNYDKHFDEMIRSLGQKPTMQIIAAGIIGYHNTKMSMLPFPEVKRVLLELRDSGYKLYIASEGESLKQWDKLIRLGLDHLFHDVFVTEEVGKRKSKEFYAAIARKLKLNPSECIMVGDSEEKDSIPAGEIGMKTVLVSRDKLKKADYTIRDLSELSKILSKL
ncbi:MAG: TIGR02253 family HAD-type hydrolase [Candidatus Micrarchaeota archaeon]